VTADGFSLPKVNASSPSSPRDDARPSFHHAGPGSRVLYDAHPDFVTADVLTPPGSAALVDARIRKRP
jgi:hypothetical protein